MLRVGSLAAARAAPSHRHPYRRIAYSRVASVQCRERDDAATTSTSTAPDLTPGLAARYVVRSDGSAALETAVWSWFVEGEGGEREEAEQEAVVVDLISAVHLGDGGYFDELQDRLECYDRVLYEMVADTNKPGAGDGGSVADESPAQSPVRWVPPKRRPPRRRGLVSRMQTAMAGMLRLSFQLDAMDYTGSHWQRADLELSTFRRLQKERKESVWTLARRVSRNVRNALVRSLTEDMAREKGEVQQWRSLWLTVPQWRAAATLLPMPLLMQLLIYAWLHEMAPPPVFSASGSKQGGGEQRGASASASDWEGEGGGAGEERTKRRSEDASDAPRPLPLGATPVAAAFLNWDVAVLLKHVLAQQLAGDFVAGVFADGDVTRSVILGERNAAAMGALRESLDGGCRRVAILYGGAHLPDLARRLETDFGASYGGTQWITAWDLPSSVRPLSSRSTSARLSLNTVTTVAIAALSFVLATDLYLWEVVLKYLGGTASGLVHRLPL